ncbi:16S rRNA (cytosine(1402)-N(4))-methyltransferase RsmH [Rubellicoccus peritrichatus]|uniref:Ribosomal RNA small subunit methyltransferase H n=1 Tax=Rubellicoccus peritrichatus TaxID=3080537 RepID=A0AAQ3LCH0_9BACT|nr:16S rRNA (cytosine(1402)-N(4))-methyltransferase RsmH [Puniceicoccus sp. CR14]WOO43544.1 16S rRNA (cytosine(1402)-N(4))-methyltransferase RsmH [Puniceicoccus sp. CR14]
MLNHLPVLLKESVELLAPERGGRFLDATFGGGGHTRAILEAGPEAKILALDCDPEAKIRAESFQKSFPDRFDFKQTNFDALKSLPDGDFNGALFDFGVSSFQLDDAARGFSFRKEAPLDLRLNPDKGEPASSFLENASSAELIQAVRDYGEESRWRKVVDAIIDARGTDSLKTTTNFAALIEANVGSFSYRSKIHPATRTFQGIRIAVNDELGVIERGLPAAFEKLIPGGVLVAISFHSLEDRIVKRLFKRLAGRPEHGRDSRPQDERVRLAELLTRKPVTASDEEVASNPRSRSAKLRAIRKLAVVN